MTHKYDSYTRNSFKVSESFLQTSPHSQIIVFFLPPEWNHLLSVTHRSVFGSLYHPCFVSFYVHNFQLLPESCSFRRYFSKNYTSTFATYKMCQTSLEQIFTAKNSFLEVTSYWRRNKRYAANVNVPWAKKFPAKNSDSLDSSTATKSTRLFHFHLEHSFFGN